MVLEPIIGFLICGVLLLLTPIYLRYFHTEAERVPEFERWIESHPLVLAFECPEGGSVDVLYALRSSLKNGEFRNPSGGYPWQHYVITLEARQLENGVVGLFAMAARPLKEIDRAPIFSPWLDALAHDLSSRVNGVWMHGRLKSPGIGVVADRERMGWSIQFGDAGVRVEPMIGHPTWLRRAA
jgi:hypothetical protein